MTGHGGLAVVDTPPGDERIVRAALERGRRGGRPDPCRGGGVLAGGGHPRDDRRPNTAYGVVICAARLGTNDLDEAVDWWTKAKVPVWGIIPERVGIAAGPESRLYREGLDAYDAVLKKALRAGAPEHDDGQLAETARIGGHVDGVLFERPRGGRCRARARGSRPAPRRRRLRRGAPAASWPRSRTTGRRGRGPGSGTAAAG